MYKCKFVLILFLISFPFFSYSNEGATGIVKERMDKFQESGEDALADLLSSSEFNVDEKSIMAAVTGINGSDTEKSVENMEEIES